jgi:hypothetical protein
MLFMIINGLIIVGNQQAHFIERNVVVGLQFN